MAYIKHSLKNQTPSQRLCGIWSGAMSNWENRFDTVTTHAWESWTKNGLGLDHDNREQTLKSVRDAVNNAWTDGMTDGEWFDATLKSLEG